MISTLSSLQIVVPLFVEEVFSSMLNWAFKKGYVRGLRAELISLPESRSNDSSSIGYYNEKYQTPETPWLVSELRGTKVYRLFKFISIPKFPFEAISILEEVNPAAPIS